MARLSTALRHEWRLESGWDYCTVVAPLWSDTLGFLAHSESGRNGIKEGRHAARFFLLLNEAGKLADAGKTLVDT